MTETVEHLATAGAVIAAELAALHQRGQVHGAVDAEHAVLVPPGAAELKPNHAGGDGSGTAEGDVAALGRLLL
ncbi:MAG: hypothetical protein M3P34_10420, partial [Actinomycetota bacterium]|nr:hypothetical protein [Actinomycetota bacterium]